MRHKLLGILILLICSGLYATDISPSKANEIKARMKARLPAITALKEEGIVGEDNSGFLAFVGEKRKKEDVVNAENKDRRFVYEAIAKQQGTTVALVGKHRAIQITKKAAPGNWLQDGNGKWYRKK